MTAAGGTLPDARGVTAGALGAVRFDRLGAAIATIAAAAFLVEPFATLRPNRIVSGKGLGFLDALPGAIAAAGAALIVAGALVALLRTGPSSGWRAASRRWPESS